MTPTSHDRDSHRTITRRKRIKKPTGALDPPSQKKKEETEAEDSEEAERRSRTPRDFPASWHRNSPASLAGRLQEVQTSKFKPHELTCPRVEHVPGTEQAGGTGLGLSNSWAGGGCSRFPPHANRSV